MRQWKQTREYWSPKERKAGGKARGAGRQGGSEGRSQGGGGGGQEKITAGDERFIDVGPGLMDSSSGTGGKETLGIIEGCGKPGAEGGG
jgi:hypothetical protein